METVLLPVLAVLAVLGISSVKVTSSSQSQLVERLGKYNRQLSPGLSLVLPGLERVVSHQSLKERVLDIPPQQCITSDNVSIEVDAVVYWQLLEHERAYYAVDNLQAAMVNLVLTQIRAEMGKLDLDQTFTTRSEVNEVLLRELDQATDPWGVKVTRETAGHPADRGGAAGDGAADDRRAGKTGGGIAIRRRTGIPGECGPGAGRGPGT